VENRKIIRASDGVVAHWARDSHGEGRVVLSFKTEEGDLSLSLDEHDVDDLIEGANALEAARNG
jgi:hypothetical protein